MSKIVVLIGSGLPIRKYKRTALFTNNIIIVFLAIFPTKYSFFVSRKIAGVQSSRHKYQSDVPERSLPAYALDISFIVTFVHLVASLFLVNVFKIQ